MPNFLQIATALIEKGFSVIPIKPKGKRPLKGWGALARTRNVDDLVKAGWDIPADANVAICADEDTVILETDDFDRLRAAVRNGAGAEIPPTLMACGSSENRPHLFFKRTEKATNVGNLVVPGLFECRFVNQYVVGPGSVHPDGSVYRWLNSVDRVAIPDWLVSELARLAISQKVRSADNSRPVESVNGKIIEGSRHYFLMRELGRLWDGHITEEELTEKAFELNGQCDPPKDTAHVLQCVRDIMRQEPYDPGPAVVIGDNRSLHKMEQNAKLEPRFPLFIPSWEAIDELEYRVSAGLIRDVPDGSYPAQWNTYLKNEYYRYIRSDAWKARASFVKTAAEHTCEKCGERAVLNVHHKTYVRLFDENVGTDLIAVCDECHKEMEFPEAEQWHAQTADEIKNERIEPRAAIITEHDSVLLYEKSINQMLAWRGVGKTNFALGLAATIASGGQILDFKADRPRKVLYIDGELPKVQLQERVQMLVPEFAHNVLLFGPEFIDPPRGLDFTQGADQAALDELLRKNKVDVLFIDSQSTTMMGDANKTEFQEARLQLLRHLRWMGLCVVEMHHVGKGGFQRGLSRNDDVLDVQITLKKPDDWEPEDGLRFELVYEKVRHAARLETGYTVTLENGVWQKKPADDVSQAAALYNEGKTQREVAKELKCSVGKANHLHRAALRLGLVDPAIDVQIGTTKAKARKGA